MDVLSDLLMEEVNGGQKMARVWANERRTIKAYLLGQEEFYEIEVLDAFTGDRHAAAQ